MYNYMLAFGMCIIIHIIIKDKILASVVFLLITVPILRLLK